MAQAARLFNEVGYHGTDSNRIARAAGYAPATFYKHFADKRAIFVAAYERWVLAEWDEIRALLASRRRDTAERVTRAVVAHHRRWAGFRRSLRALAASDDVVRAFQLAQRDAQLRWIGELAEAAGGRRPSRAESLFALLAFERVCDAIAEGETEALGVTQRAILASLSRLVRGARLLG